MEFLIIVVVLLLLVSLTVALYNRLARGRVRVDEAWAQIDAQLQRRHDLIPNLVETVKGYASHERETFEEVTAARAKAVSVQGPGELAEAENMLTQALGRLLAISENYPQLKADQNFRRLQEELAHTENMVAGARGHYNASVRAYDELRQVFPTSVVASTFNFEPRDYFEIETDVERFEDRVGDLARLLLERGANPNDEEAVYHSPETRDNRAMTLLVEMASNALVVPHLKPGQGQVGLSVSVRHLAPTPIGKKVRAETELVAIDRRRLGFKVKVFDDVEQVGEAEHERFVIDVDKYVERLKKKIGA